MTCYMDIRAKPQDSWVSVDMDANGIAIKSLTLSYSHPSRLDFTAIAAEHTAPLAQLSWIRFWDDVGLDDHGNPLSSSNPAFLGTIEEVNPGAHSNEVRYTCYDPTYRAAKEVPVMSLPYIAGTPPTPGSGAVPRLVYNVKIDSDEDYAYQVAQDNTIGQIIAGLLDYHYEALLYLDAADSGVGHAFDSSDLTPMDFIPQEKVVWESTNIRAAVEQIWRCEPRYRCFFHPASKLWRFYRIGSSPARTLYFNDSGLVNAAFPITANPYPMVACDLSTSYTDCMTAVSIYGPPSPGTTTPFYWDDTIGSPGATNLEPLGSPTLIETYSDAGGSHNAEFYTSFQIHDTTKRAGFRILPDYYVMPGPYYQGAATRLPTFLVSWDYGTTWTAMANVFFDFLRGIVSIQGGVVPFVIQEDDRGQSIVPGSTQTKFPPNAVQLIWSPQDTPLSVRYPTLGFSGTAYTLLGIQREYKIYDESLAIGKEYGVPVTSTTRLAEYSKLAQNIHELRKDVIVTGGAVLKGIDYSWCRLNNRVNLADAGGTITTGWESIGAVVTDVEYTYGEDPSTAITFNGNWLELYGEDPASMRERLRIRAFDQLAYSDVYGAPIVSNSFRTVEGYFGDKVNELSGTTISNPFVYRDQYGNIEQGNIKG